MKTALKVTIFLTSIICMFCHTVFAENLNSLVLEEIEKYPLRSGYDVTLKSGGVTDDIYFNGEKILSKGKGTYCSGFTFSVAFAVLMQKNLLKEMSVSDVRKFQRQWYGVFKDTAEKQCVDALINIGMGTPVQNLKDLIPGDFIQFWRPNKTGHSAVFLEALFSPAGEVIGIRYISSQKSTDGIAVKTEYFYEGAVGRSTVSKERFYAVRLLS